MKHAYPIQFKALTNKRIQHFTLWDGEVIVTVQQSIGAYGFCSAVVITERCDGPLETRTYSGYDGSIARENRIAQMQHWIATQLNDLATGTHFNIGAHCEIVEGLDEALNTEDEMPTYL